MKTFKYKIVTARTVLTSSQPTRNDEGNNSHPCVRCYMALLAERSLPATEYLGSNAVIGNFYVVERYLPKHCSSDENE